MPRRSILVTSLAALLVLILTLAAAACGTIDSPPAGGDSSSTSTPTTPPTSLPDTSTTGADSPSTTVADGTISHPTGADEVVLQVVTGGGFVPIEYNYTLTPEFTLYGDGRVIVTGPTTLQYPGAALPNLQTTVVSEETIQAILSAAEEAGLLQNEVDYGHPGVADVGTTTITINANGSTYTSAIYALGFDEGGDVTPEQQEARAAVNDFRGQLSDPSVFTGEQLVWEPYDFTALAVYSRPIDTTASTEATDIQPNHLPWPLADLATSGEEVPNSSGLRKTIVAGDDLETLKPLLGQATQITVWRSGDTDYNLWFRPLLPDEAAAL
jgi:hypothetical protein